MKFSFLSVLFFFYHLALADDRLTPKQQPYGDDIRSEVTGAISGVQSAMTPKSLSLDFNVEKMTLENGMVFLLHPQRSVPLVSYHTWFRVGAKDELSGESGLAHMFEHMMFKGTDRYPNREFDRILQANGIINNAFTSQDYTGYFEILPSAKLELIMDMESDRMQSLKLDDSEFQKEREVVKEERRMRFDNEPGGMGWEKLNQLVFDGSKYSLPVIGTMKEINEFDVNKLQRFYKKWYVPSNAVVVIVGDFDSNQIKEMIRKYYGKISSPPRPQRILQDFSSLKEVNPEKQREVMIPFSVNSPELFLGVQTVKNGTDDAYALDLLTAILGQGKSSRLYQELVYKQQKTLAISSNHYTLQDSGMFFIQGVAKPGVSYSNLKTMVQAELDRFLNQPIKEEELVKAKNIVLSEYVEALKTNDGKAKILALNEVIMGNYNEFFKDIDRYLKVTISDLNRVKNYLKKELRVQVVVDQDKAQKRN